MGSRTSRTVLAAVLACALLLVLTDLRGGGPARTLRTAAGTVAAPPERALGWIRAEIEARLGGSADEQARIAELEEQLAAARAAAAAAASGALDGAQARELAAAGIPTEGYRAVPARLVALAGPADQVRSAAFSAGSADGVRPGLAVVTSEGLVGLVDSVSASVATVRLVVDTSTSLTARVSRSQEVGIYEGTGQAGAITLLDPVGDMAQGDLVVTVGTADGAVPADLPIGRIDAITGLASDLTRRADVTPAIDDSTLDRVVVLVPEATS